MTLDQSLPFPSAPTSESPLVLRSKVLTGSARAPAGAPSLRPTVDDAAIEREETVMRARMDSSPERHGDE